MTHTAYNPPPAKPCLPSAQTADTRAAALLAHLRNVEDELQDLPVPVVAVPLRELDPCTACADDATVGPFAPLDSAVSVVHITAGRCYQQDCCTHHAALYVADANRQGRLVVVEVPALAVQTGSAA